MKKALLFFAIPLLLAGCAANNKKVLVLSHDKPQIDQDKKTIVCTATSGHEEKELEFSGDVSLKVTTAAGEATLSMPTKGYYIANLKNNDTIIGSYLHLQSAGEAQKVMTQVELKAKIDSLEQLIQGKNVSEANRNFFILPNTVAKITDNADATIIAPYHQMTSFPPAEDGKEPEVYRFYPIKEVRDIIANLTKLTKPAETAPAAK